MQVDLDALDALVAAATKGEWKYTRSRHGRHQISSQCQIAMMWVSSATPPEANANAICALKNAYPAIAAELREARERVRELEAEIEVRDNSANETLRILREALPNRGFHSEMEAAEAAAAELADLRARLAAAEAERDGLQHHFDAVAVATFGENAIDWKARAEAAEAERDALRRRAERAEHISDDCAYQNAALRAALEKIAEANYCWDCDSNSDGCRVGNCTRKIAVYALALTPPAAGAEAETVAASPVEYAIREFGFDRYVDGRLKAEGVVVRAANLEQAAVKASRMIGTRGTVLFPREENTCEK